MLHQYQLNGYNIVLDTCSGSVHAVDEVAYDIIGMFENHSEDEIVAAMMEKYGDREDVNEEESCLPRILLNRWQISSRSAATESSRHSVCMWHTPAI